MTWSSRNLVWSAVFMALLLVVGACGPKDAPAVPADVADTPPPAQAPRDMESVERVSRYNFDELSRILNDRVSGELAPQQAPTSIEAIIKAEPETAEPAPEPVPAPRPAVVAEKPASGALINLGGETLVLNRLPLGILVFRDQQVLFANRAITEMIPSPTGIDCVAASAATAAEMPPEKK